MFRSLFILLATAILVSAPAAQRGPALTLKTSHRATATAFAERLGLEQELPALAQRHNWTFEVSDKGAKRVTTDTDLIGNLQILAHPRKLVANYPDEWAAFLATTRQELTAVTQAAGLPTPLPSTLFDALAMLPDQVAQLRIRADGDLSHPTENLNLQAWVRAAPNTWLHSFINAAKPHGLPTALRATGNSPINMRIGIDLEPLADVLAPISRLITGAMTSSDEEAAAAADSYLTSFDGSFTAAWNPQKASMAFLAGLRDPATTRALYEHPEFEQWLKSYTTTPSGYAAEFTPAVVDRNGAKVWRSVTRPTPAPDASSPGKLLGEEIVSYSGVAGDYLLGATGHDQAFVEQLVSRAAGHQLQRQVLPQLTFLSAHIRTAALLANAEQGTSGRLPETVGLGVGTSGQLLFIRVRLQ